MCDVFLIYDIYSSIKILLYTCLVLPLYNYQQSQLVHEMNSPFFSVKAVWSNYPRLGT